LSRVVRRIGGYATASRLKNNKKNLKYFFQLGETQSSGMIKKCMLKHLPEVGKKKILFQVKPAGNRMRVEQ
jgi:hypothetical protein